MAAKAPLQRAHKVQSGCGARLEASESWPTGQERWWADIIGFADPPRFCFAKSTSYAGRERREFIKIPHCKAAGYFDKRAKATGGV